MSLIAWSLMLFAAHIMPPVPTSLPPLRVCIALDVDARLPPAIQRRAVEEAARIWAPYRVDVTLLAVPAAASSAPERTVLTVRLAGPARGTTTASSSPFGSIQFVDGRPQPLVFLHYDAIGRAIANSALPGLREDRWPAALRDHMLGRIAGRVLAHELGHFILRSPRHASRGLMRPIQNVTELIGGDGELFGLTSEDLNLLRAAMTLRRFADMENAGG
jgi:hypothetical protein